jgi:hypothetical protein
MSKMKPSTVYALQCQHHTGRYTQVVDFEVLDGDDCVYLMYWYSQPDAQIAQATLDNFVPIPYNGIRLQPNHSLLFNKEHSRQIWDGLVKIGWRAFVAEGRSKR